MVTYRDFFSKMSVFSSLLNNMPDSASINISGMTRPESIYYMIGRYMQCLVQATYPYFDISHLSSSVGILVHLCAFVNGSFDLALFEPEDVEKDDVLNDEWNEEFIRYSRMSSTSFVGAAVMSEGNNMLDITDPFEVSCWCSEQASHIAKYCISHGMDPVKMMQPE